MPSTRNRESSPSGPSGTSGMASLITPELSQNADFRIFVAGLGATTAPSPDSSEGQLIGSLSNLQTLITATQKDQNNFVKKISDLEKKMDEALNTIVRRLDRMESAFGISGETFGEENMIYPTGMGHGLGVMVPAAGYLPMGRGPLRPSNGHKHIQPRPIPSQYPAAAPHGYTHPSVYGQHL